MGQCDRYHCALARALSSKRRSHRAKDLEMEPRRARLHRASPVPKPGIHVRHWLRAGAGICLAALATAGATGSAVDAAHTSPMPPRAAILTSVTTSAAQARPATDTMTVDLPTVPASSTHDFKFSYLPAKPTGGPMVITLAVPPGWTAPVTAPAAQPSDAGFVERELPGLPACCDPCGAPVPAERGQPDHHDQPVQAHYRRQSRESAVPRPSPTAGRPRPVRLVPRHSMPPSRLRPGRIRSSRRWPSTPPPRSPWPAPTARAR